MICQKCNTVNADGMKFCGNCGAQLVIPKPQMQYMPPQPQPAPGNGQQIQPGYGQQAQPSAQRKGGNRGLIAGLVAGVAALVIVVSVLAVRLVGGGGEGGLISARATSEKASEAETSARAGRTRTSKTGKASGRDETPGSGETSEAGETPEEVLFVNKTAFDIKTGGAWIEPHIAAEPEPGQEYGYGMTAYDELVLMNQYDEPGIRSFMETYNDAESGYETTLYRNDSRVLSFMTHQSTLSDTENGNAGLWEDTLTAYNIDAQTGKELALSDVVTDIDRLAEMAADALVEECQTIAEESPSLQGAGDIIADESALRETVYQLLSGKGYMNGDAFYAWSPSYLGLRMTFVSEAVGIAYPEGYYTPPTVEVIIPYSAAQDIFVAEWTELPENFIAQIAFDTEYRFDFGAGVRTFRIMSVPGEEDAVPCAVRIGDMPEQAIDAPGESFFAFAGLPSNYLIPEPVAAYLVRQNGKHFFWVQFAIESAIGYYPCLCVSAVEDDILQETSTLNEGIMRLTPPVCAESFHMGHEFKPFGGDGGSFGATDCHIGDDGVPVPASYGYAFFGNAATYRSKVPLTLRAADAEEPVTVPAGTLFTESGTDGKTWFAFDTEHGIFYLELVEYGHLADIDGYSCHEAFEYVSGY